MRHARAAPHLQARAKGSPARAGESCICSAAVLEWCQPGTHDGSVCMQGKQQRVLELCALVFTEPHYQHISPSRKVKLNRLRTTSWGFWATFADGRTYKVPIASGLPEGENYYCNFRPLPTPCASRNDWDERCNWDNSYHPNRFQ